MTAAEFKTSQAASMPANITDYTKAMLNILEDSAEEKGRLEGTQSAVINILEDSTEEKKRLEETQRAAFNILEDFASEKERLEETQRAMLNLLEDFDVERAKAEAANHELRQSFESLRTAKEITEAVNREIESFSYSVSHDLRTPLRGMAGFSQILMEDYSDRLDEEGKDYLRRIVAAAEKMGQLIDDLLKLSRLSRAAMERDEVDLSAIARKIAGRLGESHPGRRAEFIIAAGVAVTGDARLLTVALENLLGNAWKFTRNQEKAVIEFGAVSEEASHTGLIGSISPADGLEKMVYYVKDNGAGFDMAYAEKLFNPFQRLHKTDEFPGTGIGLATVKRIVERHGGRVWIEGRVGKGTTVYFTL